MIDWIVKYWLQVLFAGILAALGFAYRRLKKRLSDQDTMQLSINKLDAQVKTQQVICDDQSAIKEAMQALLWDRLYQIYNECEVSGRISIDGLKNVENIYRRYHALGGNGVGTELYERLCNLPTRKTRATDLTEGG